MTLIIGGAAQGKLDYVLKKTGYGPEQVARTPEEARTLPVFDGVEVWSDLDEEALLSANPDIILICDEVGCGVVPVDPDQRAWREQVGRLCCRLAKRAERVERIFCGLPMTLKGDPQAWN
ncbi:bifunctional adenosylcobinamide kinase/adenosylcobinamide-phosphate guanylyltransferase [uncultured Flavonifractor sp.]|uniref:bifunctional adenosylcobinamide kinase/adenosylcobinamide-phosphate guanylyltransferase n=1 Tax=uncultured Flavonifractor sp. TaxID=1193534 RepID=UPI0026245247|nr:bifunctional adenosylcobinamide kinase/adenosylcobinamide-phosphate guanylyltransferase [uncultured Flavonifractor sp.]